MSNVPKMVARTVAVKTLSVGKPILASGANMAGKRARIYDIVAKVVRPASTSVFRLSRSGEKPTRERRRFFIDNLTIYDLNDAGMMKSNLEPPV